MRFSRTVVVGSLLVGVIAGATILQQPIASAGNAMQNVFVANDASHAVPVREQNLDAGGDLKVHEQGQVQAVPGVPATGFSVWLPISNTQTRLHGPDSGGTRYAITSLTISNQATTSEAFVLVLEFTQTGQQPCASASGLGSIEVPASDTLELSYPQPFVVPVPASADLTQPVCLVAQAGNTQTQAQIVGYTF